MAPGRGCGNHDDADTVCRGIHRHHAGLSQTQGCRLMKGRGLNIILGVYVALIFTFVFAPIFFSLVFSFNSQRFPTIPLGEFSTEWYAKILSDPDIWQAVRNSVIVSTTTA